MADLASIEAAISSRFRSLFDASFDAVLVVDARQRYIATNPAACELLGASRKQILGRSVDDFLPAEDRGSPALAVWNLFLKEGQTRGESRIQRLDGEIRDVEFTWVAHSMPDRHVCIMRDITERKQADAQVRALAELDAMTGVYNHGAIFAHLDRLIAAATPFSLMIADVDGLKATNDTHGHLIGDAILTEAARILSHDGAIVGRYGGDEFLVLVLEADRPRAEAHRLEIMNATKLAGVTDTATGNHVALRMTLGVAVFPAEGGSADALIRIADGAMYASRKRSRAARRINISGDTETVSKLMGDLIPLLASRADLTSKLRLVSQHLSIGAGYDGVDFQLFETETEAPVMLSTYSDTPGSFVDEWAKNQQIEVGGDHELRRLILSTRRPIIFNDVENETRLNLSERDLLLRTGIRSGVLIPLLWQDEVIGTLGIGSKRRDAFQAPDVEFLIAVSAQVAPIIRMGALIDDLHAATGRLASAQTDTVMMLASAAEANDPGTGQHLHRVRAISESIALELGASDGAASAVGVAAILHDIGKIRMPNAILVKPGPLSEKEWQIMRQHAAWGAEFLRSHEGFEIAARVAGAHHERWDGTGYPAGLVAEAIPEAARIVAVADAFDAITTDRPYHMGQSYERAIAEIERHSGTQFDPRVVAAISRLHARRALGAIESTLVEQAA